MMIATGRAIAQPLGPRTAEFPLPGRSAIRVMALGVLRRSGVELPRTPPRIRANAIAPGLTDTAQPRYGHSEDELRERAQRIPLERMGQPDEIAAVAVFLASDQSAFMTGQTLHANGGTYMPS